jgi:cyclohexa-1,5-dienecarbonyl-CoA hydratase
VTGDPEAALLLRPSPRRQERGGTRLRVTASRGGWGPELRSRLETVERIYLDTLMRTRDANEGLKAFLDKRPPTWEHH